MKMRLRGIGLGFVLVCAACGGGAATGKGANAAGDKAGGGDKEESIGQLAVEKGGVHWGSAQKGSPADAVIAGILHAEVMDKDAPVKLDGVLKEWPARTPAKQVVKGTAGTTTMAADLQYDAEKIYVGVEVNDDHFVRTARFGENEDRASIVLAIPTGTSWATYEIGLYAGKPGESAGSVRFLAGGKKGQEVPGAKIVEAPAGKGYSLEATLPWSTFPEARNVRIGLRGVARYYDSDGGPVKTILATGEGDAQSPDKLPPMPTQAEISVMEGLLGPKNMLDKKPSFEAVVDVAGDAMKEKVAIYDRTFVIFGPSYREGKQFFYREIAGEVLDLAARDVTGRGKDDLVLRRKFPVGASGYREWFEVWSCIGGDEPTTSFAHEITVAASGKKITNAVRASLKEIEVTTEPPSGWDVGTYREPTASDVDPVLLPWGAVKSRTFRFEGNKFVKFKQVDQAPAAGVQPEKGQKDTLPGPGTEPPTPPVKAGGDLAAQLLESFRRDRSVPADVKPKFDLQVNVAEDARPERVVLLGRDIVVFGPGFKGGNAYAYITLSQFVDAADITDLTARDVNGDGVANLIVRGVRRVTPSGSSERLDIEAMFIYELNKGSIQRIFAIETAREQGAKRIQGMVQFVPSRSGKAFEIDVRPGVAKGWTEKTYPWPQDQPGGQIEPLLLPWGGTPSLRYTWNGTAFAR